MADRWFILALLFSVRITMAFQFQSVAALAPLIERTSGASLADIGLLIGLYMSPGLVLALPGGAIGRRFGDKRVILAGLALMFAGGLIMAFSPSWNGQIAGRLIAGIGGVLLNVLMSKLVGDWFAGKEIATAMGIFVNSWPFGIALALLVLPHIGARVGLFTTLMLMALLIALGAAAFALLYRSPPAAPALPAAAVAATARPTGNALAGILVAGAIWGLFNAAIGMVFSFGGAMLTQRGWAIGAAGSATSLVLWLTALSVPAGGIIADRSGRPITVLLGGCIAFALMLSIAARAQQVLPSFIVLGLVAGLSAGPIMGLTARVLTPTTRAVGMGIFFTVFYAVTVLAPWVAGGIAARAGDASITFDLGAAMLLTCCVGVWLFDRIATAGPRPAEAMY